MGQTIKKFKYMSAVGENSKKANIYIAAYLPDGINFKKPLDFVIYFHGNNQSPTTVTGNKHLRKQIDAASNAILVGIGKAANPGRKEPKKFHPHWNLLSDILKGLWYAGGVKDHVTAPPGFTEWVNNIHPHAYGFSGGGGALTNYLLNLESSPFVHVQYNDGIYTWLSKAQQAVKKTLLIGDGTTVTLRWHGGTNQKNAKKVVQYIKNAAAAGHPLITDKLSSIKFKGAHAVGIRLLDTDKFLTAQEVQLLPPAACSFTS